jgi:CTP:phosphocholine cytidylyltransferase-like protein
MALILTAYDLTGGATDSDEVVAPNIWRITGTVTGANSYDSTYFAVWVEDEQGNWAVLTDNDSKAIVMQIKGNGTKSINPIVVNSANGLVRVYSATAGKGTVNIDSIDS